LWSCQNLFDIGPIYIANTFSQSSHPLTPLLWRFFLICTYKPSTSFALSDSMIKICILNVRLSIPSPWINQIISGVLAARLIFTGLSHGSRCIPGSGDTLYIWGSGLSSILELLQANPVGSWHLHFVYHMVNVITHSNCFPPDYLWLCPFPAVSSGSRFTWRTFPPPTQSPFSLYSTIDIQFF